MSRVDVFEAAHLVENAVEDGGVAILAAAIAEIRLTREKTPGSEISIAAVVKKTPCSSVASSAAEIPLPETSPTKNPWRPPPSSITSKQSPPTEMARQAWSPRRQRPANLAALWQKLVLYLAGDFDLVVEPCLRASFGEQTSVLDDGSGFARERAQELRGRDP